MAGTHSEHARMGHTIMAGTHSENRRGTHSHRMVPGAELSGSVAPIIPRLNLITPFPSHTCGRYQSGTLIQ